MHDVISDGNPDPIPFELDVEVIHKNHLLIGEISQDTGYVVSNTVFEFPKHSNSIHEKQKNSHRSESFQN